MFRQCCITLSYHQALGLDFTTPQTVWTAAAAAVQHVALDCVWRVPVRTGRTSERSSLYCIRVYMSWKAVSKELCTDTAGCFELK